MVCSKQRKTGNQYADEDIPHYGSYYTTVTMENHQVDGDVSIDKGKRVVSESDASDSEYEPDCESSEYDTRTCTVTLPEGNQGEVSQSAVNQGEGSQTAVIQAGVSQPAVSQAGVSQPTVSQYDVSQGEGSQAVVIQAGVSQSAESQAAVKGRSYFEQLQGSTIGSPSTSTHNFKVQPLVHT
ncbi:unnamed protein product [Ilex paraguariensis]|uniref:Uncharacterized protein n=1 Tax=Ilex paraguariensis TaxID=185542 RepID=A0ABC8TGD4_9AQUA